jgi:large subunit ribosomal protein L15
MADFAIHKPKGATKQRKLLGRGAGSGKGGTAGKGTKGQNARSGGGTRLGFEGGQMPLYRRIARRGFSNYPFKKEFLILNVGALGVFPAGSTVNRESLVARGLIRSAGKPIKILGDGELSVRLTVHVDKVSAGARRKITAAGGRVVGAAAPAVTAGPVERKAPEGAKAPAEAKAPAGAKAGKAGPEKAPEAPQARAPRAEVARPKAKAPAKAKAPEGTKAGGSRGKAAKAAGATKAEKAVKPAKSAGASKAPAAAKAGSAEKKSAKKGSTKEGSSEKGSAKKVEDNG